MTVVMMIQLIVLSVAEGCEPKPSFFYSNTLDHYIDKWKIDTTPYFYKKKVFIDLSDCSST